MFNFNTGFLLLSNQYSQICNLYECYLPSNSIEIMNYETGIKIIDTIIDTSLRIKNTPIFYLIGADNSLTWNTITKKLINYINSKNIYNKIFLQIERNINELDDFEDIITHSQTLNFNIIYNKITKPLIFELIKMKHFSKVFYKIDLNNYNHLYKDYLDLNANQVRILNFSFNPVQFSSREFDLNNIYSELYKIKDFIIQTFQDGNIPLVPINISNNFLKIIIQDKEELNQEIINFFHQSELMTYHCNMMIGKKIIINQYGELFLCSKNKLDNKNKFYCGTIDNPYSLDQIIFNIFNIPLEQLINIAPTIKKEKCQFCNLKSTCNIDCFANNFCYSEDPLFPNKIYCSFNNTWDKITKDLILTLDNEKNELFKNYFFIYCQKGLDCND